MGMYARWLQERQDRWEGAGDCPNQQCDQELGTEYRDSSNETNWYSLCPSCKGGHVRHYRDATPGFRESDDYPCCACGHKVC